MKWLIDLFKPNNNILGNLQIKYVIIEYSIKNTRVYKNLRFINVIEAYDYLNRNVVLKDNYFYEVRKVLIKL